MEKILFLLFLLLPTAPAFANQEVPAPETSLSLIDKSHREISDSLSAPSRWFDNFFSDPRADEEQASTLLRLRGAATVTDGDGIEYDTQFKIRLRLPRLERRFNLILTSKEDDFKNTTTIDRRVTRELADKSDQTTLALQYNQKRSSRFGLSHRIGVSLSGGINPKLRSRVRYSLPIADESLLTLTQAVFWEHDEGFGEETRIDYDIPFRENMLFRATGQGLFSENSDGYEWITGLLWRTAFSKKRAISVSASTEGETRPENYVTKYSTAIRYRQAFLKKWLFFDLRPAVNWEREDNFKAEGAFTLGLEVQFGEW